MTKTTIVIPPIKLGLVQVTIRGRSPLIVKGWTEKVRQTLRDKHSKAPKEARPKRDPQAEFEAAKYKDAEGRDCILAAAIKHSIVGSARNLDGVKMTELRQQIFVLGERIPIEYDECECREDMVRVSNGNPDLRYRPMYTNWRATFVIEWHADALSLEQVLSLLQTAGFSVGIHEWRPSRGGEFGRFELEAAEAVGALPEPPKKREKQAAKSVKDKAA